MKRVLCVSTDRSDVGVLEAFLSAAGASDGIAASVFLTGAHTGPRAPKLSFGPGVVAIPGGAELGGRDAAAAAEACAAIQAAAGACMERVSPDVILCLGDRIELLSCLAASLPFNLPIAHMHGGDVSLGAVDDRIRHAITKLAHLHFPASLPAAMRLKAMGEEAWRIKLVGAPGLDALRAAPEMSRAEFAAALGLPAERFLLVTVHPETNAAAPDAAFRAVVAALEAAQRPALFTAPNDDPGGAAMRTELRAIAAERPWATFCDTLGTRLYANALRLADAVIGNSSSGIIEAGLFATPALNVGERQAGRDRGQNVIDVPADPEAVRAALARVAGRGHRSGVSLYGDGKAAHRIAAALRDLPDREILLRKQLDFTAATFVAPWAQ